MTKRLYGEKHRPKRPVFFCSVLFSEGSVPVVRTGDADVGGVELGVLALLALAHIVLEHGQALVAEDEDDRDIDDDHRALEHVGRIPREAGADDGADEHERRRSQTEHRHARLARVAPKDILQAALAVIVVADERREREQAHGDGDEDRAEAAERLLHGRLHIGGAGGLGLYQQINEFSTYTVPTKLILEGVNFDNIVSQLEGYSTTVSNVIKQLNSVGSSLQGGLDSYNAQKEASEQLDAVTKTTGEYAESYNRFKNAMDSLIEHKKTERPENEKEAAQWDEQLKNLLQEANTAKDDYQNQIDKERDGISSLAKKFDTAASKERSAYDTLVDGVTTAVSTKQASEKDVLNKNIQDNKGVIKEIDRQLAALGDDPQGENREEKRQLKALRDQVQERINEDTDSINKIANETTSMKEITDELKTGDNAKDVLEDYNSEACVDSLKGLNEEMEFLKGMDLETMNADSLENLAGKLHQVDLSKFSDTSSYKELWNNVRQSVGQESIQGVPMDFIDGIFALLSIDTLYDEDLNSKIDLNYYGKLPSQRIRSAQEYSLDSPFEKEDQKTAQDNLNKIGLPISEADSVELDGGINVGGQADDDGEATGNLFKKMIQMVNRLKKKMEGYKAVVDSMSNLAKGNSWDKVLLMGYLTYSVSNRTNYDSGVSLSGASFSGSGGLAPKYEAQNVRGEFLVKEENKYSFCGAEMEYLMTGKMSEYENQASVFSKLVALQSVMSIWAVANDPFVDGMKIGWSTAAAAVPYAGPALSFAMKILTPVLFAMANGTVDTLLLVNGNKVQLFKTAKGVHVNPTGFASALETLMNSKMFDSKDQATFKSVNEKMQARRD